VIAAADGAAACLCSRGNLPLLNTRGSLATESQLLQPTHTDGCYTMLHLLTGTSFNSVTTAEQKTADTRQGRRGVAINTKAPPHQHLGRCCARVAQILPGLFNRCTCDVGSPKACASALLQEGLTSYPPAPLNACHPNSTIHLPGLPCLPSAHVADLK
jgi:hypothetical protein